MSYLEHKSAAEGVPVQCAVVTVSDTRTKENDGSGTFIRTALGKHGFEIARYEIIPDDPMRIGSLLHELAGEVDAILLNGGTGISRRDSTVEVVSTRLEKTLPGFGELFRMLSYEEIGSGSMLSRAVAGLYRETLVFAMPGSTNAVQLAVEKLILPELKHLVWEVLRQQNG